MKNATSKSLYDYWNTLRGKRSAPDRSEITPQAMKDVLAQVFILECEDELTHSFRLAGTEICKLFGQEIKDKNLMDFWSRTQRESIESLLYSVTEDGAAAVLGVEITTETGQTAMMEMLFLPLKAADGRITRILGSVSLSDKPVWMGVETITEQTIKSFRLIWPDHTPRFVVDSQASRPVFEPAFADKMPARREASHLRVVEGGADNS